MKRALVVVALALAVAFGTGIAVQGQAEKAPGTVILKGAPLGGVKFDHVKHVKLADNKCETCHHPSKAEKPSKTAHQKCDDCHTKTAAAPMKTKYQAAFHDPMAKTGTCVNCHQKNAAAGKAPTKCNGCHMKSNT
jgi:hypothetical protein